MTEKTFANNSRDAKAVTYGLPLLLEVTLPPQGQRLRSYSEFDVHLSQSPRMWTAFHATYENSDSLQAFLEEHCQTGLSRLRYLKQMPFPLFVAILELINGDASLGGCAFLASLFSSFRANASTDKQITEAEVDEYVKECRSLKAVLISRGKSAGWRRFKGDFR
jgi:hypothetical protein